MRKTQPSRKSKTSSDDIRPEYTFDYSKARRNRFAGRVSSQPLVVLLDPDVAEVFTTPESVNHVLRTLIAVIPQAAKRRITEKR